MVGLSVASESEVSVFDEFGVPGHDAQMFGGKQSSVINPPEQSAAARVIAFSSSRTLPGKAYAFRASAASLERLNRESSLSLIRRKKWRASNSTSPVRTRSGGSWIVSTLRR